MNVTHMSREDVVSEMLAPLVQHEPVHTAGPLRVSDAAQFATPAPSLQTALAHRLNVARELLLRDLREQMHNGPLMSSPQILRDWLRLYCAGLEHEIFLVLYLDASHRLIEAQELFRGTLTQTSVYLRELVKGALACNAAALALAHTPVARPNPTARTSTSPRRSEHAQPRGCACPRPLRGGR